MAKMEQKKRQLKLEVKTLETRIAPGMCKQRHLHETGVNSSMPGVGPSGTSTNSASTPDWQTTGGGAGVPVIGIN